MPPLTRPLSDVYLIELNRNQFESDPVKSRAEILKNKVLQLIFKVGADIDILIWTLIVLWESGIGCPCLYVVHTFVCNIGVDVASENYRRFPSLKWWFFTQHATKWDLLNVIFLFSRIVDSFFLKLGFKNLIFRLVASAYSPTVVELMEELFIGELLNYNFSDFPNAFFNQIHC